MTKNFDERQVIEILDQYEEKLTPLRLFKTIAEKAEIEQRQAKKLVKKLIDKKELSYTYFFGSTYIEPSFNKPVNVTEHFVLAPERIKETKENNKIKILIDPGISFGCGRHPTTRLSLEAIDYVAGKKKEFFFKNPASGRGIEGLDIGTGSGVLAIAACKSIIDNCIALDIDPNSISEAKRNVRINNLHNHISVSNNDIQSFNKKFALILANLRYPTLKNMADIIAGVSQKDAVLIMSGIRSHEKKGLIDLYNKKGFKLFWEKDEKNWSCAAMQN